MPANAARSRVAIDDGTAARRREGRGDPLARVTSSRATALASEAADQHLFKRVGRGDGRSLQSRDSTSSRCNFLSFPSIAVLSRFQNRVSYRSRCLDRARSSRVLRRRSCLGAALYDDPPPGKIPRPVSVATIRHHANYFSFMQQRQVPARCWSERAAS